MQAPTASASAFIPPAHTITAGAGRSLWREVIALLLLALAPPTHAQSGSGGIEAQSLAPREPPGGRTLFAVLPPEQTGVFTENHYADPAMWGRRYHEFEVGGIGTGVAIADYDGDGRPDIFVVSKTESCRLFRNLGDWKFADVTEAAGVADAGAQARVWKQGAAFADVNNDGRPDLYVCRFDAPNLLYVNQGDGTFREQAKAAGVDAHDASLMAAFADFDRDGWLDLYLQTNLLDSARHPEGQPDRLYRNRGDGTFADVTATAGIAATRTQGNSATWWDFNDDGWPDLYVANDFAVPDFLYRNNGDGTFTNVIDEVVPHVPYSAMGADVGDVNNDGRLDFFVADMAATTPGKDLRGMADSRARTRDEPEDSTAAPNYLRNALYLNTGVGRCLEAAFLAGIAASDWTWSTRFEDFDNDGRLDLHITTGMHREVHNADLLQRVMLTEDAAGRVRLMKDSPVFAEPNLVFRNRGDLQFDEVGAAWGLDQRGVSFGSATGDLDGDGDLDLVFTNYEAGVTLVRNDSTAGHRVVFALRGTRSNRSGVGATIAIETASGPQVRTLVSGRGYMSTSEPILHFGLGDDERMARVVVRWPSGHVQTFEQLAADQRYVITEPDSAPPETTRGNDASSPPARYQEVGAPLGLAILTKDSPVDEIGRQRLLPLRHHRRGPSLAVGDVDGDERDDIVIGGTSTVPPRVLLAQEQGTFVERAVSPWTLDAAITDGPVLLFDANGDDLLDLLVTRGGAGLPTGSERYQPRLLLNLGGGRWQPAPPDALPQLHVSTGAAAAADFNRDGRLDVFLGGRVRPGLYPLAPHSALLVNRGNGAFADATSTVAPGLREPGMVTAALWSDVDVDGWPDLLLALDWGTIKFFRNDRGERFEDRSEPAGFAAAGSGWWTSLAAADFNRDGRLDYAAGNVGLNTPYHADAAAPALLYLGSFKAGGGPPQLIEAHHHEGRGVPWQTRRNLGALIPEVLRRYPSNDDYAAASLGDILGEDKLRRARAWAATELRSGVFLSQPDGTHRFAPAPRLAQIAPWQGMAAGDFDGDGHADLYVVQNSFAPAPWVGRFDGGLSQLLRGDGQGDFAPVPPAESGLVVSGDAKALVVVDVDRDGWPDFVASRNHDTTLAFRHQGRGDAPPPLRIVLRGPPGNARAVGARVTCAYQDGQQVATEVYAGSSYYSQSTSDLFFGHTPENRARSLIVQWPDGASSTHEIPGDTSFLHVAWPGR